MTKRQSRWVNIVIIALVVILRGPTLLPSMSLTDEDYYSTIASDILDGGKVYQTAVDTKPPGIYYIYAGVYRLAGRNNLFAIHLLAIFVVIATALVVRRIGARVGDEWAGAWSGIGYAVFVHAYLPGDTLAANTEIFASLFLSLSILAFLQGEKEAHWVWMFFSGTLVGAATLIRQPSAVNAGVMLVCLVYGWLLPGTQSLRSLIRAASAIIAGVVAPIAALALYYKSQGNLYDAYCWAWVFAIRYVESETTLSYVLKHLVTIHLTVLLCWGLLWYFGIRQVIASLKSVRWTTPESTTVLLLVLWLIASYLTIFIGWRFPGHYHLTVLPPLSILAGQAFCRFLAQQQSCPKLHWRFLRIGIIGAAAVPILVFFVMAFGLRKPTLDHRALVQAIIDRTNPTDRIFVWGSRPRLYSFSGRGLATRFVSCTHLVGAYAKRPREIKDRGKNVIPGVWQMFRSDWQLHPPALIIDTSAMDADSEWAAHPMTRYPALREYLSSYRKDAVINGATIYRRL